MLCLSYFFAYLISRLNYYEILSIVYLGGFIVYALKISNIKANIISNTKYSVSSYSNIFQILLKRFLIKYNISYLISSPPKAHAFVTSELESNIDSIFDVLSSLDHLIPQLKGFIEQFHGVVTDYNVNVVTDSAGNMSVDVPQSMSDKNANLVSTRLRIIDKLIADHESNIHDLFKKGFELENNSKSLDSSNNKILLEKLKQFKSIKGSYNH